AADSRTSVFPSMLRRTPAYRQLSARRTEERLAYQLLLVPGAGDRRPAAPGRGAAERTHVTEFHRSGGTTMANNTPGTRKEDIRTGTTGTTGGAGHMAGGAGATGGAMGGTAGGTQGGATVGMDKARDAASNDGDRAERAASNAGD